MYYHRKALRRQVERLEDRAEGGADDEDGGVVVEKDEAAQGVRRVTDVDTWHVAHSDAGQCSWLVALVLRDVWSGAAGTEGGR